MKNRSWFVLILLLVVGSILGSYLWHLLCPILPDALAASFSVGATKGPWVLDLNFLTLTFGLTLEMNIGTMIGLIAAIVFYFRKK